MDYAVEYLTKNVDQNKSKCIVLNSKESFDITSGNSTKKYEKIIQDSKVEAKNYFNQTREKILKNINQKKNNLEKELNEEIKKAENEIKELKKNLNVVESILRSSLPVLDRDKYVD